MAESLYDRLLHADWSIAASKRWVAEARRTAGRWQAHAPKLVGPTTEYVRDLLGEPQPTLAGFDFPIGVPAVFGARTSFGSFREALGEFGKGDWSRFYDVAERPEEVSLHRPFYPRMSSSLVRQKHLTDGLCVPDSKALLRQCEKATSERPAASSLFWTLGAKQVGKAAISGWREIVQPATLAGALLWPFDGALLPLAGKGRLVICETYPAEAYGHVGIRFSPGESKQKQADRRKAAGGLLSRCKHYGIDVDTELEHAIEEGFGSK